MLEKFESARPRHYVTSRGGAPVKRQNAARVAFGAELKRLRLAAGLTQWDVSMALEYSTAQFVSNWERGISMPPYSALDTLADVLGLPRTKLVALIVKAEKAELAERHRQLLAGA